MNFHSVKALFHLENAHDLASVLHEHVSYVHFERSMIDSLNRWLKQHSCKYLNEYAILYHGTSAKHDVLNQGLKRTTSKTKRSIQSATGFVCLSLYPEMAQRFAEMAYPTGDAVVYAVRVPLRELLPDRDQLANKRLWGEYRHGEIKDTLADSFFYGSGARIKRDIAAYDVRLLKNSE